MKKSDDKIILSALEREERATKIAEHINKIDEYIDLKFMGSLYWCYSLIKQKLQKAELKRSSIAISQLNKLFKPILEITNLINEYEKNTNNKNSIKDLLDL